MLCKEFLKGLNIYTELGSFYIDHPMIRSLLIVSPTSPLPPKLGLTTPHLPPSPLLTIGYRPIVLAQYIQYSTYTYIRTYVCTYISSHLHPTHCCWGAAATVLLLLKWITRILGRYCLQHQLSSKTCKAPYQSMCGALSCGVIGSNSSTLFCECLQLTF